MCGRFSLTASVEGLISHFGLTRSLYMSPRYNIAPQEMIPVIRNSKEVDFLKWGFKPNWFTDPQSEKGFINARSETILEKPSFKRAFEKRRCLIIADGYYEWKIIGRIKQPYYIKRKDSQVFAMAGIWEDESCAILTTDANALIAPFHDRMPVILTEKNYENWLNASSPIQSIIMPLLTPTLSETLQIYPVTTRVNNPNHDSPECIRSLH